MLSLYNLSIQIPSSVEENKLLCIKPLGRTEEKLKTRYDLILTIIPDFPCFTWACFEAYFEFIWQSATFVPFPSQFVHFNAAILWAYLTVWKMLE